MLISFQHHYLSRKIWKTGNAFAHLDQIELSPESSQGWRKLSSDIITPHKKGQRRRTTGTTFKFNFIDIIVIDTVKAVFMILSW